MKDIYVTKALLPPYEEYCNEIKDLFETHMITNMGEKHNLLQKELEKFFGVENVVLFSNGHLALENLISAFDFPKGSEIITTPFTFVSTTHAIVRNNLVPVFCDIKESDFTIDENKIEALISEKTVAILPVHVYGNICNVEKIQEIANRNNLKVIYDAAHSFGVSYKGVPSACFGDASMFSFHATKVFNTVEGGCVCCKDQKLVRILNDLKNFGFRNQETVSFVGGNAKLNEFQASMGLCNLRHIKEEIEGRRRVFEHYVKCLKGTEGISLPRLQENVLKNYAYFPVLFDNNKFSRDEIYSKLNDFGIHTRKYFYPLTNSFDCYKDLLTAGVEKTPVAFRISQQVLTLPIYSSLLNEDIDYICSLVKN